MTPSALSVLHIVIVVNETSAQYNEHCLPAVGERDVSICSFRPTEIAPPMEIALFEGDGSPTGFVRALDAALAARSYDVLHVHAPQTGVLYLLDRARRRAAGPPAVCTVHNSFGSFSLPNRMLLLPMFAAFRRVVLCSRAALDSFPAPWRALGGNRVAVIPNGVDTGRVDRELSTIPPRRLDTPFRVVSVGRLIPRKDPLTLLRAFLVSRLPGDELVFIGSGALESEVLTEASLRGAAGAVRVTGTVPREEVYREVADADVFVSTSRGEGLPVAVLEAMACRRPVILSDIPPHREIASSEGFVPMLAPGDVPAVARAIAGVRRMRIEDRRALGDRCRRRVDERFSLSSMHAAYGEIYQGVADPFAANAARV